MAKLLVNNISRICRMSSTRPFITGLPSRHLASSGKLHYSFSFLIPQRSNQTSSQSQNLIQTEAPKPDTLIKTLTIEVQAHDRALIESYNKFMAMASDGFKLDLKVMEKPKFIWKKTVLKSVHVHKKHRVQYETRNYYKVFELKHLTGSTASTFLEYVQRNLPEGVAMKITTETVERLPEHFKASE